MREGAVPLPRGEGGGEAARTCAPKVRLADVRGGRTKVHVPDGAPPRAAMSPDVGHGHRPGFATPFLVRRARRGWLMRNCSTPNTKEGRAPPMWELPPKAAVSRRVFRWSPSHGGGISSVLVQLATRRVRSMLRRVVGSAKNQPAASPPSARPELLPRPRSGGGGRPMYDIPRPKVATPPPETSAPPTPTPCSSRHRAPPPGRFGN